MVCGEQQGACLRDREQRFVERKIFFRYPSRRQKQACAWGGHDLAAEESLVIFGVVLLGLEALEQIFIHLLCKDIIPEPTERLVVHG